MMSDINDDEIRIIGNSRKGDGRKHISWWVWAVCTIVVLAVTMFVLHPKQQDVLPQGDTTPAMVIETCDAGIWHSNNDVSLPSCVLVTDTLIDRLHLRILTPCNTVPELHVGKLDTNDSDILMAAMAADLRRDNGKIVGAFVYNGEPLSWGLSKKGYCAISDEQIAIGVAENSPLFEQMTETGGYFFRQYPAVDKGTMVENNPENASYRRALCLLEGKVCIVACTDRVLMNDFSATLVKLGVSEAILLVGGATDGWFRSNEGQMIRLGPAYDKNARYVNYIVFRKQS